MASLDKTVCMLVMRRYPSMNTRTGSLIVLVLLVALAGCKALRVEHPRVQRDTVWLTEGGTPQRSGRVDGALRPPLEPIWVKEADAGFGAASPLVLGDAVLVATRQGEVVGYDLQTGRSLGREGFGESIEATPVIEDGMLVVPVDWGRRILLGYDLHRAQRLWAHKGEPVSAGLARLEDRVVAADVVGAVRLVEARTGEVMWETEPTGAAVYGAPLIAGDAVIVVDEGGIVRSLALQDGSERWRQRAGGPVFVSPSAGDSRLLVATARGGLYAFELGTGRVDWQLALSDTTVRMTGAALGRARAYIGATDGVVRAVDLTDGDVVWETRVDDAMSAPPMLTGDVLYVATLGERLLALEAESGEVVWEYELDGRVKSPMAVADGHLVVLAEPKDVYVFARRNDALAVEE